METAAPPSLDMFSPEWDTRSCASLSRNSTPRSSLRGYQPGICNTGADSLTRGYHGSYRNGASDSPTACHLNGNVNNNGKHFERINQWMRDSIPPPLPPPRKENKRHDRSFNGCMSDNGIESDMEVMQFTSSFSSPDFAKPPPLPPPRANSSQGTYRKYSPPPPIPPRARSSIGSIDHIYETLRSDAMISEASQDHTSDSTIVCDDSFTNQDSENENHKPNRNSPHMNSSIVSEYSTNVSFGTPSQIMHTSKNPFIRGNLRSRSLTPQSTSRPQSANSYYRGFKRPLDLTNEPKCESPINIQRLRISEESEPLDPQKGSSIDRDKSTPIGAHKNSPISTPPSVYRRQKPRRPHITWDVNTLKTADLNIKSADFIDDDDSINEMDTSMQSNKSPFSRTMNAYLSFRDYRRRPIVTASTWEEEQEFLKNSPTSPLGKRQCMRKPPPNRHGLTGSAGSLLEKGEFSKMLQGLSWKKVVFKSVAWFDWI